MPTEKIYAYDHAGLLHNEGVEYVINKLSLQETPQFYRQDIIVLTAEFMFLIDCCDANINEFMQKNFKLSKIKLVLFIEFLTNLHNIVKSKSVSILAKEANISTENLGIIEMIFGNETDIEGNITTSSNTNYDTTLQMLDFLENKSIAKTENENEKRALGLLTSIGRSSIQHGLNVIGNPALEQKYELVNSRAADDPNPPPGNKIKKFKWPWKADCEGALGGLISGGIGGALGGPAAAAVGGLLGAVGGSISNSIIKSIPAFNSKT
jgi:predicted transcriptional regulator